MDDHARLMRFSCGREGMWFDHARALQELELLRAQRAGQAMSDKRLDFLEALGPKALETVSIPACGIYGSGAAYLSYNSAYIQAQASVNISGPVQPGLALAWAWAESGASGVQEQLKTRGLARDGKAQLYASFAMLRLGESRNSCGFRLRRWSGGLQAGEKKKRVHPVGGGERELSQAPNESSDTFPGKLAAFDTLIARLP